MRSIDSYFNSYTKISILLMGTSLFGVFIIISEPNPYQVYYTYTQQLTSTGNAKTLPPERLTELNRKFNLMDMQEQNLLSFLLDVNAYDRDECTIENINQRKMQQDHPCVIDYISKNYLKKPPSPGTPLKLNSQDTEKRSAGQTNIIHGILKHQKKGFFVDCGAQDGESSSDTIYLEHKHGWTGILIEAHPDEFKKLEARNRQAHLLPTCLSLEPFPTKVSYLLAKKPELSHINGVKTKMNTEQSSVITMQCFPLYSILLAVGRVDVDYFNLDVEGHELAILKTIPFHRTNIKTFSVEFDHIPEGLEGLSEFMEKSGYMRATILNNPSGGDAIFIKDFLND